MSATFAVLCVLILECCQGRQGFHSGDDEPEWGSGETVPRPTMAMLFQMKAVTTPMLLHNHCKI